MNEQKMNFEDEIVIDVRALMYAIFEKKLVIVLTAFVFAIAAFAGSKLFMTPQYDSATKILIISRQNEQALTYSDLQIGSRLTMDYTEIVKSTPVLEEVILKENLDMTTSQLRNSIRVELVEDSRIVYIIVRNEDPALAQRIANALRDTVEIKFEEITSIEDVYVIEEANLPKNPATPNVKRNTLVGGFLGVLLVLAIIVIRYMADDTIKNAKDVETKLGLTVLASLPVEDVKKRYHRNSPSGSTGKKKRDYRRVSK